MTEENTQQGNGWPRKMYKGNWKCDECGKKITELPFEPVKGLPLYCQECHQKRRAQRSNSRRSFQRRMYQGSWKCANCGKEITELPFEPRNDQDVYCSECYREKLNNK